MTFAYASSAARNGSASQNAPPPPRSVTARIDAKIDQLVVAAPKGIRGLPRRSGVENRHACRLSSRADAGRPLSPRELRRGDAAHLLHLQRAALRARVVHGPRHDPRLLPARQVLGGPRHAAAVARVVPL